MAFSFDDSEFAESNAADEVIESLESSPAPTQVAEEDPELADVDLRLQVADYYRAILNHSFFDTDNTAAERVDREIRTFIRERLEVLLGLRVANAPPAAELPFEEDEITALKALAAKVLQKPSLIQQAAPVKKMAAPTPTAKPTVKQKPQARKIPTPPPAPSTKPKAKPITAKPAEAPKARAPIASSKKDGEEQTFIDHAGKQVTLVEGEIIEENGRRFLVARNEKGTLYRRDITGQVSGAGRLPPQTPQQMSAMSERLAHEAIGRLDETTGLAIVASLQAART